MCYNPTDYIHLITHSLARAKSDPPPPPPPKDSAQNRGLFLHPLGALTSPLGAHTRAVLGARLARVRAPWPLCSNAEPQELRHGGGSSAGLALLPSSLLELRADSRWTHFLSEVNITRGRGSAEPRCFLFFFLSLCRFPTSLFTFPPFSSTNSEEAKSTTWLHPVTGEAVVTGHRKTPGTHAHAHAECTGRLSARHGGGGKKWSISRGEEGEFFPCSRATASPSLAPPLWLPRADHLRAPHPPTRPPS